MSIAEENAMELARTQVMNRALTRLFPNLDDAQAAAQDRARFQLETAFEETADAARQTVEDVIATIWDSQPRFHSAYDIDDFTKRIKRGL